MLTTEHEQTLLGLITEFELAKETIVKLRDTLSEKLDALLPQGTMPGSPETEGLEPQQQITKLEEALDASDLVITALEEIVLDWGNEGEG